MQIVRRGAPSGRLVALTFDDGPNPQDTPEILAVLRRFRAQATFFVVGDQVARFPQLARSIAAEGHEVGNHSLYHDNLTLLPTDVVAYDLRRVSELITLSTGRPPRCFRPPYGATNAVITRLAGHLGLRTVLWGEAHNPSDWSQPGVSAIVSRVLARARPGMIVPLHDGGGDRWQTAAALPLILEGLRRRGLRCVSVSTLLRGGGGPGRRHPAGRRIRPGRRLRPGRGRRGTLRLRKVRHTGKRRGTP